MPYIIYLALKIILYVRSVTIVQVAKYILNWTQK